MLEDVDVSPMALEINNAAVLLPSHRWLLEQLPLLPLFELVKMNVCTALRHVNSLFLVGYFVYWELVSYCLLDTN